MWLGVPCTREASVWEACCWYSGVVNMFLNCLMAPAAPRVKMVERQWMAVEDCERMVKGQWTAVEGVKGGARR